MSIDDMESESFARQSPREALEIAAETDLDQVMIVGKRGDTVAVMLGGDPSTETIVFMAECVKQEILMAASYARSTPTTDVGGNNVH